MADIRIKDLPTAASLTASDDFIAIDGTTNGTRKLNAAAPAFLTSVTTPSLTSPAATNLTLTSGLVGTNKVNFPDTLSASSATVGAVTVGNGTTATNVAIGGGKIVSGDVFNSVKTGNGAQNAFGFATASATSWTQTSIDVNDANGGIIAPYLNGSCFGYLTVNATGPLMQSRNNYAAQVFNSSNKGLSVAHSTGDVTFNSSTAGSSGAGALVIAGGISAGNTGSAASYFGGAVTAVGAGYSVNASGTYGMSLLQIDNSLDRLGLTAGASVSGATFTARYAAPMVVRMAPDVGVFQICVDSGKTIGNAYTPTGQLEISSTSATFSGVIFPKQATTAAAPAYVKGAIYFDTTLNKLRVGGAIAYETITSV